MWVRKNLIASHITSTVKVSGLTRIKMQIDRPLEIHFVIDQLFELGIVSQRKFTFSLRP